MKIEKIWVPDEKAPADETLPKYDPAMDFMDGDHRKLIAKSNLALIRLASKIPKFVGSSKLNF